MVRLEANDRQKVVKLLAVMPIFNTHRGRYQIFEFAGLGLLTPLVNFEGEPFVVASQVIQSLESYGRVSYEHEALGVFLSAIKEFISPASDEGKFLEYLLRQYNLMTPLKAPEEITDWKGYSQPQDVLEKIVGENTLRNISFLKRALEVSRAVALVDAGEWVGTGFMINSKLLMTNSHVLPSRETAAGTVFRFNYQLTFDGMEEEAKTYTAVAGGVFQTNRDLDYSIVEIEGVPGDDWAVAPISTDIPSNGNRVNIIQHPAGLPKQISFQNNFVEYSDQRIVQYLTSTLNGSSGSPVFDDQWKVVALHHAGGMIQEPKTNAVYFRNEGIAMSAIIKDLPASLKAEINY